MERIANRNNVSSRMAYGTLTLQRLKKPQFALPQHAVQLRSRRRGPGSTRVVALRQPSPKNSPRNSVDTTLAWGDAITLAATELASERIPFSQLGFLCSIMVVSWVGVAVVKGDYRITTKKIGYGQLQSQMILAVINAAATWALFVPTAFAAYASMMSHHYLDHTAFIPSGESWELAPQVEVVVATFWTVVSWRGIYTVVRPYG